MFRNTLILIFTLVLSFFANAFTEPGWIKKENKGFTLYYTDADKKIVSEIETNVKNGVTAIEKFFAKPFTTKISIYIFPDRSALDAQWQKAWGDTGFHSQCWMVASGVSDRLDVLSPNAWTKEACDHNGNDKAEIEKIIAHELTHVFHGQYNPTKDFTGMDDMSWMVEGLATYVSGQLDKDRIADLKKLSEQNKLPNDIKKIWSGKSKYALAGSLLNYLDKTYGRKTLIELLSFTTNQQTFNYLKTDEQELIKNWKNYLTTL